MSKKYMATLVGGLCPAVSLRRQLSYFECKTFPGRERIAN